MVEIKDGDIWKMVKYEATLMRHVYFICIKEREYEKIRLMRRDQASGRYECHETLHKYAKHG